MDLLTPLATDLQTQIISSMNMSDIGSTSSVSSPVAKPSSFSKHLRGSGTSAPHTHDVLCGRGGAVNHHPGNQNYRKVVAHNRKWYVFCLKNHKILLSKSIVESVQLQDPPGRFLAKNEKDGLWYDIGFKKAMEKTSQALREGAVDVRKEQQNLINATSSTSQESTSPTDNGIIELPHALESSSPTQTMSQQTSPHTHSDGTAVSIDSSDFSLSAAKAVSWKDQNLFPQFPSSQQKSSTPSSSPNSSEIPRNNLSSKLKHLAQTGEVQTRNEQNNNDVEQMIALTLTSLAQISGKSSPSFASPASCRLTSSATKLEKRPRIAHQNAVSHSSKRPKSDHICQFDDQYDDPEEDEDAIKINDQYDDPEEEEVDSNVKTRWWLKGSIDP